MVEDLIFDSDINLDNKNVTHQGNVIIKGDVYSEYNITAKGDILIYGNVTKSIITSTDGKIIIKKNCIKSNIKAFDEVNIGLNDKGEIYYVEESVISSDFMIKLNKVYPGDLLYTELEVTNIFLRNVPRKILELNKRIKEVTAELSKYKRVMEVLKTLGEKVNQLPEEKKNTVIQQAREFGKKQTVLKEFMEVRNYYQSLIDKDDKDTNYRIFIMSELAIGTRIKIEDNEITTKQLVKGVKFLIEHNRIGFTGI